MIKITDYTKKYNQFSQYISEFGLKQQYRGNA